MQTRDEWMRLQGFGRDAHPAEVVTPTAEHIDRAKWVIGQLIHYPTRPRSSYAWDVETVAKALAASEAAPNAKAANR